jgi:hypothetical protein
VGVAEVLTLQHFGLTRQGKAIEANPGIDPDPELSGWLPSAMKIVEDRFCCKMQSTLRMKCRSRRGSCSRRPALRWDWVSKSFPATR